MDRRSVKFTETERSEDSRLENFNISASEKVKFDYNEIGKMDEQEIINLEPKRGDKRYAEMSQIKGQSEGMGINGIVINKPRATNMMKPGLNT